jgi:hypothetical protein
LTWEVDPLRDFIPVGLTISAQMAPCANHCRFCLLADRKTQNISVGRFVGIVEKFIAYKEQTGFEIKQWFGNSYNFQAGEFQKMVHLFFKNGINQKGAQDLRYLLLGGMPVMTEKSFRAWLADRQIMGCVNLGATYCGLEPSHDHYCSRSGHFGFQIMAQKIAAEMGLLNMQRLLLMNSTLSQLEMLMDILDETGSINDRHAFVLFYNGSGKTFESERPTFEQLSNQPPRIMDLYRENFNKWKSEMDWIKEVLDNPTIRPRNRLVLKLTEENIDQLEKMSCEEIVNDLSERTKRVYEVIPSLEELAEKYSDQTSRKVYMSPWDVECLWLDRFMALNPEANFESQLIHFGC